MCVLYLRLFNDVLNLKESNIVCHSSLRHSSVLVPGKEGDTSLIPHVLGDAERGHLNAEQ